MKDEIINSLKEINKLNKVLNEISHAIININYNNTYQHPKDNYYSKQDFNSALLFLFQETLNKNNFVMGELLLILEELIGIKIQGRKLNVKFNYCMDEKHFFEYYEYAKEIDQANVFKSVDNICYKLFDGKRIINQAIPDAEYADEILSYGIISISMAALTNEKFFNISDRDYRMLKKHIPELDINLTSKRFNIKKTDLHNLIKEKLITVVKNLGDGKIYLTSESIGHLIDIFYNYYAEYITTSDGRYIPNENIEPITTKYIREELKRILGIPTSVKHSGFYSVQEIAEHTNLTINQIHKRLSSCSKKGLLKFHYLDKSKSRKTPSKNDKKYISHQDFIKIFKRELDQDKINQLLKGGENVSN